MASELVVEPQNRSESMKIRLFRPKITQNSTKKYIFETSEIGHAPVFFAFKMYFSKKEIELYILSIKLDPEVL